MFSGKCGENATWEYDPDTCKLTISGTGAMYDYNWDANSNYPRKDYAEKITSAEIEDGITYIGTTVFEHCKALSTIKIPDSVTKIGAIAFANCTGLTSILRTMMNTKRHLRS